LFLAVAQRNKEPVPLIAHVVLHKTKLTRKAPGLKPSLVVTFMLSGVPARAQRLRGT